MPHPIAYVSKAEWNQWLEKFKETFALKLLISGQLSEQAIDQTIFDVVDLVESEKGTVFEMAANAISGYCGIYCVSPKDQLLDEFKHIYFLAPQSPIFYRAREKANGPARNYWWCKICSIFD